MESCFSDKDDYVEDGFTVVFDDDSKSMKSSYFSSHLMTSPPVTLYPEYAGEDFSKYLDEDESAATTSSRPTSSDGRLPVIQVDGTSRTLGTAEEPKLKSRNLYKKRKDGGRSEQQTREQNELSAGSDHVRAMVPSYAMLEEIPVQRRSKKSLQERLGQVFVEGGRFSKKKQNSLNKIHNFSFADLKIGNSILTEQQQQQQQLVNVGDNMDSGSEIQSTISETRSDFGCPSRKSSWWDLDTLSDRQLNSKSDDKKTRRTLRGDHQLMGPEAGLRTKTKSVPNISELNIETKPNSIRFNRSSSRDHTKGGLSKTGFQIIDAYSEGQVPHTTVTNEPRSSERKHSIWKKMTLSWNKRKDKSEHRVLYDDSAVIPIKAAVEADLEVTSSSAGSVTQSRPTSSSPSFSIYESQEPTYDEIRL